MPIGLVILITDLELGGSPLIVRELAGGLRQTGRFTPQVVSLKPLPPSAPSVDRTVGGGGAIENRKSKIENPTIPTIPELLRADNIPVFSLAASRSHHLPRAVARFARHLRTHRPQIVLSVLIHANLVATLARPFSPPCALVHSIHTLQAHPRWHWWLQRALTPWADGLIVPSPQILAKLAARIPAFVIPNGIDIDRFADAKPLPSTLLPWPPQATTIGYLGRFDPVKNLPLLLRAFARLPRNLLVDRNLHLALIGHGPQEAELRQLARELGLAERTHFLGPTTEPERYYKSLSIFCLPSEAEGFGLVALEARVAGCRLVLADTPVLRAVSQAAARYVGPLTIESLAHVISEVIDDGPNPITSDATVEQLRGQFSLTTMVNAYAEKLEKNFQISVSTPTASSSVTRSDK